MRYYLIPGKILNKEKVKNAVLAAGCRIFYDTDEELDKINKFEPYTGITESDQKHINDYGFFAECMTVETDLSREELYKIIREALGVNPDGSYK